MDGSAPDIAGKNIANLMAQILSLALLFGHTLKKPLIVQLIEHAVEFILKNVFTH